MIVSDKHKFIFFCNGRTGTTSIEFVLSRYHDNNKLLSQIWHAHEYKNDFPQKILKHCPPYIVKNILKDQYPEYFTFIFARNPYDWLISQIFFNFQNAKRVIKVLDSNILSQSIELLANFRCFREDTTLFQYQYLLDKEGNRIIDYVGHFETLNEDWNTICSKIGIPHVQLPYVHIIKKKPFQNYYSNKQIIDEVYTFYKKDFDLFNYSKKL